jgi:hypothetical protein
MSDGGTSGADRINRRAFLERAVFGAATFTAFPAQANAATTPLDRPLGGAPRLDAFEGKLLDKGKTALVVERWGQPVRVDVPPEAELWRGQQTTIEAFLEGDDVLVRFENGLLTSAWGNLATARGLITRSASGIYVVDDDFTGTEMEIALDNRGRYSDAVTGQLDSAPASLPVDTWIDVAGLRLDGAIIASVARLARPGAEMQPRPELEPPRLTFAPDGTLLSFEYRQFASYYDCPTGAGRCGTCNTSSSTQTAWPALDTCNCCSITCCDCAKNCFAQAYLSCGIGVLVRDACGLNSVSATIVDCGPCNNRSCHTRCMTVTCTHVCSECGTSRSIPIVDLTKPTFSLFRNPSAHKCMLANVSRP